MWAPGISWCRTFPSPDWLHQWPAFTKTSYKDQPLMDPHAAANR